jgi:hypothetical protein
LCISERWRTRTAQSAPLTGNHRVEFDIDARAANVVATKIESYDNGMVRRRLQIPATHLCAERKAKAMVIVMGRAKLGPGEIDGLRADMEAQIRATRAGDGCSALRFFARRARPRHAPHRRALARPGVDRRLFCHAAHGDVQ